MKLVDKRSLSSPLNGQKGGVKSAEGKGISKLNATKHGVFVSITTDFDHTSFEDVYKSYVDEFGDGSPSREMLVSQLAVLHIRLLRCTKFETEFVRELLDPPVYEKRMIKSGLDMDFDCLNAEYEDVLISGSPMTIDPTSLNTLDNVYTKYEAQFLSRYCRILEFLTQTEK